MAASLISQPSLSSTDDNSDSAVRFAPPKGPSHWTMRERPRRQRFLAPQLVSANTTHPIEKARDHHRSGDFPTIADIALCYVPRILVNAARVRLSAFGKYRPVLELGSTQRALSSLQLRNPIIYRSRFPRNFGARVRSVHSATRVQCGSNPRRRTRRRHAGRRTDRQRGAVCTSSATS
jgi:hypothetical protein